MGLDTPPVLHNSGREALQDVTFQTAASLMVPEESGSGASSTSRGAKLVDKVRKTKRAVHPSGNNNNIAAFMRPQEPTNNNENLNVDDDSLIIL